jgi:hypothetical protein
MPSQEEIDGQQELLAAHRQTLAQLLSQRANFSAGYVPAHLDNGIQNARDEIDKIKGTLRGWGESVEDSSGDFKTLVVKQKARRLFTPFKTIIFGFCGVVIIFLGGLIIINPDILSFSTPSSANNKFIEMNHPH